MAVDMFLKIDGIEGSSTDDAHKGEIEVLSYSWNVAQPRSGSTSSGGSNTAERANFGELSVVHTLDKASPKLALACAGGENLKKAVLTICRAAGDKQPFMEYTLSDVNIMSVRPGGASAGEAIPCEEFAMTYGQIEWKYTETKVEGGKAAGNVAAGWNLKTNKKV